MTRFGSRALTLVCAALVSCSTLACGDVKSPTSPDIDPVLTAPVTLTPAEPPSESSGETPEGRDDAACGAPHVPTTRCRV
jgi:hypothetical protein